MKELCKVFVCVLKDILIFSAILGLSSIVHNEFSFFPIIFSGVIHCLHWGLGHGSGSVLGGALVHNIGSRNTFALFAGISLVNFFMYVFLLYCKRTSNSQKQDEK